MADVNFNGTDTATVAEAEAGAAKGIAAAHVHDHPVMVGTPVRPEIRQVRPPSEMGAGYRETEDGVH